MPSIPGLMILGLLADRPHTAYELVKRLSFPSLASSYWGVSDRTWYREPARLVDAGLAQAVDDGPGSPPRYTVTEEGRRALTHAAPQSQQPACRNEPMAILYAVAGQPIGAVLDRLRDMEAKVRANIAMTSEMYRTLAHEGPDMPDRAAVSAVLGRRTTLAMLENHRWATWAIEQLEALENAGDADAYTRQAWADIASDLDDYLAEIDSPER